MVAHSQSLLLSVAEYLQMERISLVKHEYINGAIYAMAGANDAHVTIALNMAALLRNHIRGSGCRVYITDMKVRLETPNCFYYPDIMVTCNSRDRENSTYKCFPKLIVEVLSASTEAFDRGDKFADYQTLTSLEEYVLVNTRHQRVECFRRHGDGMWILQSYTPESKYFTLQSVELTATLAELYEDVELATTPNEP
ncbi:Uma2 family endonuclease [Gloeomargaritales cyanobacterium VI4D9]|nr:Uma2 family endonuclease [Gloeomargaritales cyanobacterium VI4D9]